MIVSSPHHNASTHNSQLPIPLILTPSPYLSQMMWAADFDARTAAVFLHHPPEGLNLQADPLSWPIGLTPAPPPLPSVDSPLPAPSAIPSPSTPSSRRPLWRLNMPMAIPPMLPSSSASPSLPEAWGVEQAGAHWGQLREAGGDLAVFCVAAILRANRKAMLQVRPEAGQGRAGRLAGVAAAAAALG